MISLKEVNEGSDIPEGCECDIPEGSECDIPEESECDIPEGSECDIPEGSECDIPEGSECDIPEGSECDIPEGSECDIPEGSECDIPEGSECDIPEGSECDIPEGSECDIPEGSECDIPEGSECDIPEGSECDIPEVIFKRSVAKILEMASNFLVEKREECDKSTLKTHVWIYSSLKNERSPLDLIIPGWGGFEELTSENTIPVNIGYQPAITAPPTEMKAIYAIIHRRLDIMQELEIPYIFWR